MNIVLVMPNVGGGGAERVGVTLAGYLAGRGHHVGIAYFLDGMDYPVPEGVELYRLKYKNIPIVKHAERAFDFIKYCRKKRIELVVALYRGYDFTFLQHKLGKSRLILSERSNPVLTYSGNWKERLQMKLYFGDADAVVFQTETQKRYFKRKIQKKGCLIPNPVKSGLPERFEGERDKEIVNFCRLTPEKNLKLLIDSFCEVNKRFPEYVLKIYGDGGLKSELTDYIKEKKLEGKARILPFSKDIHSEVRKAAMFVSSSDNEGISNSMLEAMALGLPCICTDCPCGGASLMIRDGENGLLVPTKDKKALTQAMTRVIADPELARQISEEAARIRESHSAKRICQRWERLMERVTSENA